MGVTKQEQIEEEDRRYAFYLMGLYRRYTESDAPELDAGFAQALEEDDE